MNLEIYLPLLSTKTSWVSCLEKEVPPEISGEEAFEAMKAVFAALESARTGRRVSVDELEV